MNANPSLGETPVSSGPPNQLHLPSILNISPSPSLNLNNAGGPSRLVFGSDQRPRAADTVLRSRDGPDRQMVIRTEKQHRADDLHRAVDAPEVAAAVEPALHRYVRGDPLLLAPLDLILGALRQIGDDVRRELGDHAEWAIPRRLP